MGGFLAQIGAVLGILADAAWLSGAVRLLSPVVALRAGRHLRPIRDVENDCPWSSIPRNRYAFASPVDVTACQGRNFADCVKAYRKRHPRYIEVHKLADGTLELVGYASEEVASLIDQDGPTKATRATVFSKRWSQAPEIVHIPSGVVSIGSTQDHVKGGSRLECQLYASTPSVSFGSEGVAPAAPSKYEPAPKPPEKRSNEEYQRWMNDFVAALEGDMPAPHRKFLVDVNRGQRLANPDHPVVRALEHQWYVLRGIRPDLDKNEFLYGIHPVARQLLNAYLKRECEKRLSAAVRRMKPIEKHILGEELSLMSLAASMPNGPSPLSNIRSGTALYDLLDSANMLEAPLNEKGTQRRTVRAECVDGLIRILSGEILSDVPKRSKTRHGHTRLELDGFALKSYRFLAGGDSAPRLKGFRLEYITLGEDGVKTTIRLRSSQPVIDPSKAVAISFSRLGDKREELRLGFPDPQTVQLPLYTFNAGSVLEIEVWSDQQQPEPIEVVNLQANGRGGDD